MTRSIAFAAVLAASTILASHQVQAQGAKGGQDPGAMAGGSYLPSTHTKGCGGLMCDGNDAERAPGAPPPPPCQGLMCSLSPYSMGRPVTAAEAQRLQQEQARTQATAPPPAATEPVKKKRSAHRKKSVKTVAARTPDPATAAPAGAPQ